MHSRAAKRASSPGIDLDKSLKDIKPPAKPKSQRPSILAVHQGAGVTKKSKNGRKTVLSARAKRRQEKGLDRAEAVMDKKEKRVEKSKDRARTVQDRAKAWEDLNKKMLAQKAKEEALTLEKQGWESEEADSAMQQEDQVDDASATDSFSGRPLTDEAIAGEAVAQSVRLPEPTADEDEILE